MLAQATFVPDEPVPDEPEPEPDDSEPDDPEAEDPELDDVAPAPADSDFFAVAGALSAAGDFSALPPDSAPLPDSLDEAELELSALPLAAPVSAGAFRLSLR